MLRHKYVHTKSTFKNVLRLRCFVIAAAEDQETGEREEPMALPRRCISSPSTAYIIALLLPSALYCRAGNGTYGLVHTRQVLHHRATFPGPPLLY